MRVTAKIIPLFPGSPEAVRQWVNGLEDVDGLIVIAMFPGQAPEIRCSAMQYQELAHAAREFERKVQSIYDET